MRNPKFYTASRFVPRGCRVSWGGGLIECRDRTSEISSPLGIRTLLRPEQTRSRWRHECETQIVNVAGFSESGVPVPRRLRLRANNASEFGCPWLVLAVGGRMSRHRTRRVRRRRQSASRTVATSAKNDGIASVRRVTSESESRRAKVIALTLAGDLRYSRHAPTDSVCASQKSVASFRLPLPRDRRGFQSERRCGGEGAEISQHRLLRCTHTDRDEL